MLTRLGRRLLLVIICVLLPAGSGAQAGRSARVRNDPPKTQKPTRKHPQTSQLSGPGSQSELERLKIETDLVTVPVVATDRNGLYIPDLRPNEFVITEDSVPQEIAFFATTSVPFHVVLMLDTSASVSTRDKLELIRQAAVAFVEQLQSMDRVKVISFDDQVRDINDFTSDRGALRTAIYRTRPGQGSKLYDAFALALASTKQIQGRKVIVMITDGVDFYSDATLDGTLRALDEERVLVYPIRYSTREDTERTARQAGTSRRREDSIGLMLDRLYSTADRYLKALANKSGGRLLPADTLESLPDAFANIATELRTQYSIGYYPTNKARDEGYRKIKVNSTRKNVAIRTRPGYRALGGG